VSHNDLFRTPILFLVFNRPDTTKKVFDVIRKIKPKYLYIAADGPRENKIGEKERCEEVKSIVKYVDWDCELKTLFRDKNLGCRIAVSSAIDWFFENVSEGIILEDDCLPSLTFFPYCEELLNKYRDNEKIMTISGDASPFKNRFDNSEYSYFFSHYPLIWGWATWKRAWLRYDVDLKNWNQVKKNKNSFPVLKNWVQRSYWLMIFNQIYTKRKNSWAYQWTYNSLINNGLAIIPKSNLTFNIGYGDDSTHYRWGRDYRIEFPVKDMDFPLVHNVIDEKNIERIDKIVGEIYYGMLFKRTVGKIRDFIFKIFKR